MSKNTKAVADMEESREALRKLLNPGDTVYCILRNVSSSGMSRVIDLVIPVMNMRPVTVTGRAKKGDRAYTKVTGRDYFGGEVVKVEGNRVTVTNSVTEPASLTFDRSELNITRDVPKPGVRSIGWLAARAMGRNHDSDRSGIKIGGCGMDMGFALVYDLGHVIWPNGTKKPHGTRNGQPDRDGGYALKHSWL